MVYQGAFQDEEIYQRLIAFVKNNNEVVCKIENSTCHVMSPSSILKLVSCVFSGQRLTGFQLCRSQHGRAFLTCLLVSNNLATVHPFPIYLLCFCLQESPSTTAALGENWFVEAGKTRHSMFTSSQHEQRSHLQIDICRKSYNITIYLCAAKFSILIVCCSTLESNSIPTRSTF